MSIIYRITCIETGKFYIGSTVNKAQRWARHRNGLRAGKHPNKHMQAAWSKYGEGAFVFEVIEEVDNPAMLLLVEQKYLDEYAGKPECFNWAIAAGAPLRGKSGKDTPNFGKAVPLDVRAKISVGLSGANHPNWGKPIPEERKQRIRESNLAYPHKERKHTPEAIAKIAAASTGRKASEETKLKMSLAQKGHEVSTAQRLQISRTLSGEGNFWYGKKRPESFAAKIRKAILVTDGKGTQKEYPSIQALREELGLKPPTVNRALKSGLPIAKGDFRGWVFKYLAPPEIK